MRLSQNLMVHSAQLLNPINRLVTGLSESSVRYISNEKIGQPLFTAALKSAATYRLLDRTQIKILSLRLIYAIVSVLSAKITCRLRSLKSLDYLMDLRAVLQQNYATSVAYHRVLQQVATLLIYT